jgi:hypothetical protein
VKFVLLTVAFAFFTTLPLSAQDTASPASIYRDAQLGISMTPPAFRVPADAPAVQLAAFNSAGVDGFSANLNIQVHQKTNLDTFRKNSEAQFKALGIEIVTTKEIKVGTHRGLEYVYRANLAGIPMKFIAVAAEDADRVFLLTATSLEQRFNELEPVFRAALSSFKFDK